MCIQKLGYCSHHVYSDVNDQVFHVQGKLHIQDRIKTRILLCLYLLKWLWPLWNGLKVNMWPATGDNLCSKFAESQTESTSDIQRCTLRPSLLPDDHEGETQRRFVLNHIHACMLQNQNPVVLSLLRPSACPAMHNRKLWVLLFFGGGTTINPYSLLLLSDTHCTHSYPLPFLFSEWLWRWTYSTLSVSTMYHIIYIHSHNAACKEIIW